MKRLVFVLKPKASYLVRRKFTFIIALQGVKILCLTVLCSENGNKAINVDLGTSNVLLFLKVLPINNNYSTGVVIYAVMYELFLAYASVTFENSCQLR